MRLEYLAVQDGMRELVRQGKPVAVWPVLISKQIHRNRLEVIGNEAVDLECLVEPMDRDNVNPVLEFDDLLDWDRNRT
jgi:hypothetical protein